jgi:hypothetical protein
LRLTEAAYLCRFCKDRFVLKLAATANISE